MNKRWALGVVAVCLPSLVLANGNHPMAGCGLGYLLLSHDNNSKVTQIVGATTNHTFGSQTFGITSGTSGCTEDGAVKLVKAVEVFAEVNLDVLRREMAAGNGEFVYAFASLLGATETNRSAMVHFFQANYSELFPSAGTTSTQMLEQLSLRLAEHPELLG